MRQLVVAAPCVCCRRCSRRSSAPAWHPRLFQFHLTALVIKSWTDTAHQITAVITCERRCVHKTISLTPTPFHPPPHVLPAPSFSSDTDLSHVSSAAVQHLNSNIQLSPCSDLFNDHFKYLVQNSSSTGLSGLQRGCRYQIQMTRSSVYPAESNHRGGTFLCPVSRGNAEGRLTAD